MANIHGLSSPSNYNRAPSGAPPQADPESAQAMSMFGSLQGSAGTVQKVPRQYHFGDFWTATFCPNYRVNSFPFVIWVINTLIFITSLILSLSSVLP